MPAVHASVARMLTRTPPFGTSHCGVNCLYDWNCDADMAAAADALLAKVRKPGRTRRGALRTRNRTAKCYAARAGSSHALGSAAAMIRAWTSALSGRLSFPRKIVVKTAPRRFSGTMNAPPQPTASDRERGVCGAPCGTSVGMAAERRVEPRSPERWLRVADACSQAWRPRVGRRLGDIILDPRSLGAPPALPAARGGAANLALGGETNNARLHCFRTS